MACSSCCASSVARRAARLRARSRRAPNPRDASFAGARMAARSMDAAAETRDLRVSGGGHRAVDTSLCVDDWPCRPDACACPRCSPRRGSPSALRGRTQAQERAVRFDGEVARTRRRVERASRAGEWASSTSRAATTGNGLKRGSAALHWRRSLVVVAPAPAMRWCASGV